MTKGYWAIVALAFIIFVSWVVFAYYYASTKEWNYSQIGANADYWGGVLQSGSAILGNALLLVAILLQRDELKRQSEELRAAAEDSKEAQRIAVTQSEQITRQAEISERAAELARVMPLLELRTNLVAHYYEQKGRTDVNMLIQQIKQLNAAIATIVKNGKFDEATRSVLLEIGGEVDLESRSIRSIR